MSMNGNGGNMRARLASILAAFGGWFGLTGPSSKEPTANGSVGPTRSAKDDAKIAAAQARREKRASRRIRDAQG